MQMKSIFKFFTLSVISLLFLLSLSPFSIPKVQAVPLNLIANPNLSTATTSSPNKPEGWASSSWGNNKTTFSYLNQGYGGSKAVQVNMTNYHTGDGKWYFNPVTAVKDQQYQFSDYYKSNVNTQVGAAFNMSNGTFLYQIIGQPYETSNWTNFTTDFSVPVGAKSFTIFHLIQGNGSLTTSDFSLTNYTPVGFNQPMVTLTFDDGYSDTYNQGLPVLNHYGFKSTQFIITGLLNKPDYMTNKQVVSLYKSGNEIASHTVTHDDLTQKNPKQLDLELRPSQVKLENMIHAPVSDLAYPYGLYDKNVVYQTHQAYAASRGVEEGLNDKNDFNPYDIKVQNVYNTTTTAQVADWVAQAKATNTWLVLVYHSVDTSKSRGVYNVTPQQLNQQLGVIKSSKVSVVTMHKAIQEIDQQLSIKQ
jgi:peptidoglycan/xylan/chitin deacetylase (PgdA/CDA1 family)